MLQLKEAITKTWSLNPENQGIQNLKKLVSFLLALEQQKSYFTDVQKYGGFLAALDYVQIWAVFFVMATLTVNKNRLH